MRVTGRLYAFTKESLRSALLTPGQYFNFCADNGIPEPKDSLLMDWFGTHRAENAVQANNGKAKPTKKLIKQERNSSELLCLVYKLFDAYGLKEGSERGKYSAKVAWGDLVAGNHNSNLIKEVAGERKTARLKLNGGDEVDYSLFANTYNRRFK